MTLGVPHTAAEDATPRDRNDGDAPAAKTSVAGSPPSPAPAARSRLLKCLRCSGTGYATPPRPDRPTCPACLGEGEVPEDHPWSGYEWTLDACEHGSKCPLPGRTR